MRTSAICATLVSLATVQAGVLHRKNAAPTASVGPDDDALASAYLAGTTLSGSRITTDNVTAATIRLYGFDGCENMAFVDNAIPQIYSGWLQAQGIMGVQALQDGNVDFNTAGALEYLGASGLNTARQADMNLVFKEFAKLTPAWWPFGYRIHVRCDDPVTLCPCGLPSPTIAYTYQKDSVSGYAAINFCPNYFKQPSLDVMLDTSQDLPSDQKYDMSRYRGTQGATWAHETMHIDWVAGAYGPNGRYGHNEHVQDLSVTFKKADGSTETISAYGAVGAKLLARWHRNTGDYVMKNAENLSLFMVSQYVQKKLGNKYPYLPVLTIGRPSAPPFKALSDGTVIFDDTAPEAAPYLELEAASQGCTDDSDNRQPESVDFESFAPDSAYPADYISSLNSWRDASGSTSDGSSGSSGGSTDAKGGQQLALATYIDPGANMGVWERIISLPSDKVSVVVANVVNGPDSATNAGWTDVIPRAKASGKTVLGYVRTGYLGVSFQQFTTRLGSSLTSDWVAQIQEDVDQWYRLYPGSMGGIFFDEAWNDCGDNNVNAELYKFITQSTKKKYGGAMTVLNPGAPMPQCFEHSADTLLTAEIRARSGTSSTMCRQAKHAALAKQRHVGLLHITDDVEPNPYDTVPGDGYMSGLIGAISGGKPLIEGIILPTLGVAIETVSPFLKTTATDYTSASFAWAQAINAIGYRLYQDDVRVLELTPSMTAVTVGGLTPGTAYVFYLEAINPDGTGAGYFDSISLSTTALPKGGHTVSSTSVSASTNQAVYSAKILVPYAFVRLFIWNGNCKFVADAPLPGATADDPPPDPINWGWPINFQAWYSVCNQYMVEDGKLHKYTGVPDPTTGYMPWSWTYMDAVPVVQDGYDWTWTLPLGTADIKPNQYIVQVQGYGPRANVYNKCPKAPDSKLQLGDATGITTVGDYCI